MKISLIAVVALTLVLGGFAFGLALQQQHFSGLGLSTETRTQEEEQERPPGVEAGSWKPITPDCGLVIDRPIVTYKGRIMAKGRIMTLIAGQWVEVYVAPGPAELVHVR
jgi:hypothetical protein